MGPQFERAILPPASTPASTPSCGALKAKGFLTPAGIPREHVDGGESADVGVDSTDHRRGFCQRPLAPQARCAGAALGGVGAGAIAGFILSSLLLGGIAAIAVFLFSAFGGLGGGGRGRALGGRGGPILLPGGWTGGGGGWSGGGGGGWSSGGGGDFSGGGGGSSW